MRSTAGQKGTWRLEKGIFTWDLYRSFSDLKLSSVAWKPITFVCSVSTWPCLEIRRIILHLVILLAFSILALTIFVSLVEIHCCVYYAHSDNGFCVLPRAEATAISTLIILVHDYYSRLCSLRRHLGDRGKWFTSHPHSEIHGREKHFFIYLPVPSSELANKTAAVVV